MTAQRDTTDLYLRRRVYLAGAGLGLLLVLQVALSHAFPARPLALLVFHGLGQWWAGLVLFLAARHLAPSLERSGWQAVALAPLLASSGTLFHFGSAAFDLLLPAWAFVVGAGFSALALMAHLWRFGQKQPLPDWLALLILALDWLCIGGAAWVISAGLVPPTTDPGQLLRGATALQLIGDGALLVGCACWLFQPLRRSWVQQFWLLTALACRCGALFWVSVPLQTATYLAFIIAMAPGLPVRTSHVQQPTTFLSGFIPWMGLLLALLVNLSSQQGEPTLLLLLALALLRGGLGGEHGRQQQRRLAVRLERQALAAAEERQHWQTQLNGLARLIHDQGALINGLWRVQQTLVRQGHQALAHQLVDHLEHLHILADRLRTAVRQPVAAASLRRTSVDGAAICAAALDAARDRATRMGVTLCSSRHATRATIIGDPTALRRVIDNLLTNALDATPAGGLIDLELWNDRAAPGTLTITVRDSGDGLSEARRGSLFLPRAADQQGPGMGLGLVIVQELVMTMGGEVGVAPPGGRGTSFWVRLPLGAEQQETKHDNHFDHRR
jgi:signal transduction histidine kinase